MTFYYRLLAPWGAGPWGAAPGLLDMLERRSDIPVRFSAKKDCSEGEHRIKMFYGPKLTQNYNHKLILHLS